MPIQERVWAALAACVRANLVVLPLAVVACFAIAMHLKTLVDEPSEDIQRSAYDIAAHIDRELDVQRRKVERLAAQISSPADLPLLRMIADALLVSQGQNILVMNSAGTQIFNAQFPLDPAAAGGYVNPAIGRALADGVTTVSDLYKGSHSGDWRVAISTPLITNERIWGVLSVTWSPETFMDLVNGVSLYPGSRWSIGDRQGLIIARPAFSEFVGKRLPYAFLKDAENEGVTVWSNTFTTGEPVVRAWGVVKGSGWIVSVVMPRALLLSQVYIWLLIHLTLLAGAILLIGFVRFLPPPVSPTAGRQSEHAGRSADQQGTAGRA